MGKGNQVRGLIIASKARGWDPNEMNECNNDPGPLGINEDRVIPPLGAEQSHSPRQQDIMRSIPSDDRGAVSRTHNKGWAEGKPGDPGR